MRQFSARIIKSGRITIPDEIRELLSVEEGDIVDVNVSTVDRFEKIKASLDIRDERTKHAVAGIDAANAEEMDIGV